MSTRQREAPAGRHPPRVHPPGLPFLWLLLLVSAPLPPPPAYSPPPTSRPPSALALPAIQSRPFSGETVGKPDQRPGLWHWRPQAHPVPAALKPEPKPLPLGLAGSVCLQPRPWPKPKICEKPRQESGWREVPEFKGPADLSTQNDLHRQRSRNLLRSDHPARRHPLSLGLSQMVTRTNLFLAGA